MSANIVPFVFNARRDRDASQNRQAVHRWPEPKATQSLHVWQADKGSYKRERPERWDQNPGPAVRSATRPKAVGKDMTYESPTTGDQVGMSFLTPRTHDDLERRHQMMRNWAKITCGMMGRTPDFLNVSLMSMAAAGKYFGENRPEFEKNIQNYYEFVREQDLVLTHTLVNIQRNRHGATTALDDSLDVALSVIKETDEGIIVHGARVLAPLANRR
ncbi:MAG: hypothetical protein Ct9H300mP11_04090 [Chloroflexota bacterium]|nr:MAG: hypothetical protein Ct9H300mP11_04090 [Chloroflexota bacterium]